MSGIIVNIKFRGDGMVAKETTPNLRFNDIEVSKYILAYSPQQ